MDGASLSISPPGCAHRAVTAPAPGCENRSPDARAVSLLDIVGLHKRYGDQTVLAGVDFGVAAGDVLGIIGPNGAGKTTLLETIAGVTPADAGAVFWRGTPLPQPRRRECIFYLPDGIRPYHDQPVARVLGFFAGVYRRRDTDVGAAIAAVGLAPVLRQRVQTLSKGYARRLMLALGLLVPHPLVLMDEPFDGFDLRQMRAMAQVLRGVAGEGRTLVLAIHQLADAERVCDRFVLLADGCVRGSGTLAELRARIDQPDAGLEEVFLALT